MENIESNFDTLSVMVCDDSALMRNLVSRIINEAPGMQVAGKAMNGKMLLDSLNDVKPDVIVLDIEMPVMTGVEASKVIRNLHKQDAMTIPIISVTANSIFENVFFSRKYGMDDYVGKPIEPENLYAVLKKWFDKYSK